MPYAMFPGAVVPIAIAVLIIAGAKVWLGTQPDNWLAWAIAVAFGLWGGYLMVNFVYKWGYNEGVKEWDLAQVLPDKKAEKEREARAQMNQSKDKEG